MEILSAQFSDEFCEKDQKRTRKRSLLTNFLSDPYIASVSPSSRFVAESICQQIDFSSARNFVEYGPGNGAITKYILANMNSDAKLYAIDTSQNCIDALKNEFSDPRLEIINGSAENASKLINEKEFFVDAIISGIPFSLFSRDKALNILRNSALLLKSNGSLITYQTWIPPFITPTRLKGLMDPYFKLVSEHHVYRNFPPLNIMVAKPRACRTRDKSARNDDEIINHRTSVFELTTNKNRIHQMGSAQTLSW